MNPALHIGEGYVRNGVWSVHVTSEYRSKMFAGYRLPEAELFQMVDANVEYTLFIDPERGRYTANIEDWLDNSVSDKTYQHRNMRLSWFERG